MRGGRRPVLAVGLCVGALALASCARSAAPIAPGPGALALTSPAFADGESIPSELTCDGVNTSPALEWRNAPAGTGAWALVVDDPDASAGTFVHWVGYNIPAGVMALPAGQPTAGELTAGGTQGVNGTGRPGYVGPCPPTGTHHYIFRLYALDATLDLAPGATRSALDRAMQGHVLAETRLTGTYARQ